MDEYFFILLLKVLIFLHFWNFDIRFKLGPLFCSKLSWIWKNKKLLDNPLILENFRHLRFRRFCYSDSANRAHNYPEHNICISTIFSEPVPSSMILIEFLLTDHIMKNEVKIAVFWILKKRQSFFDPQMKNFETCS